MNNSETSHSHSVFRSENLKKQYKNRTILEDISLNVKSGEIVGLLGPNGAGKTTCFYLMVGLLHPDHGNIFLNNQSITNLPLFKRAQLGISYLPQEPSIFRKLTVEENILAALELQTDLNEHRRTERLEQLLEDFHLHTIRQTVGILLSGGERRRVEIARAMATMPQFILLDEPFAGVDPISIQDVKLMIKNLAKKNIGILITDHNVREALDICDRSYVLYQGKTLIEGTPAEILNHEEVKQYYLGSDFLT